MTAYDARCLDCGGVHVVNLGDDHAAGDEVRCAHKRGGRDCDGYGGHRIEARLDGVN